MQKLPEAKAQKKEFLKELLAVIISFVFMLLFTDLPSASSQFNQELSAALPHVLAYMRRFYEGFKEFIGAYPSMPAFVTFVQYAGLGAFLALCILDTLEISRPLTQPQNAKILFRKGFLAISGFCLLRFLAFPICSGSRLPVLSSLFACLLAVVIYSLFEKKKVPSSEESARNTPG